MLSTLRNHLGYRSLAIANLQPARISLWSCRVRLERWLSVADLIIESWRTSKHATAQIS